MLFMNKFDIASAIARHGDRTDNLGHAVRILGALHDDVENHSDGWAHWPVPVRAARNLIDIVSRNMGAMDSYKSVHADPVSQLELTNAIRSIRAFYTRAHLGRYGGPFPSSNHALEAYDARPFLGSK